MLSNCRIGISITNQMKGAYMANKNKTITVRLGTFEEQKLAQDLEASGFSKGRQKSGKPNISSFIRWLILYGTKPIKRKHYAQLIKVNVNLIKVGGLLNQFLYHANKERKIMIDHDLFDENNKSFLNRFDHLEKLVFEIHDDLKLMKNIMHETLKTEGV